MPDQYAMVAFSGVLVGASGGALTVLVSLIINRVAKLIEDYLWLVSEPQEIYSGDFRSISVLKI